MKPSLVRGGEPGMRYLGTRETRKAQVIHAAAALAERQRL